SLRGLHAGNAQSRWSTTPLDRCRDFDRLVLAGGAALAELPGVPPWKRGAQRLGADAFGAAEAALGAISERATQGLPAARQPAHPAGSWRVADVGQTAVKIAGENGERWHIPRDVEALPIRQIGTEDQTMDGRTLDVAQQRQALRGFLTQALRHALTEPAPHQLLLALPCELDDALCPGGSSYIGMGGDLGLVCDVLQGFADRRVETYVLNDAELAALGALPTIGATEKALVVTLGFAAGGALVQPLAPTP
ncbi:MAG: hypothetical protein AAF657_14345, partial [Acidobacteriota bacterium]